MQKLAIIFSLIVVAGLNTAAFAQDDKKEMAEKKGPNLEMALEMTKTIMIRMFEKAGLDEEQTEKVTKVIDENVKDLVYTRQAFQEVLTPDQQRKLNSAKKQARKAKYDDKKAEEFGLKKLKLDAETMKKYKELNAKVIGINDKINSSISAILTDEQKDKLPIFKNATKKAAAKMDGSAAKKDGSAAKGSDSK